MFGRANLVYALSNYDYGKNMKKREDYITLQMRLTDIRQYPYRNAWRPSSGYLDKIFIL